MRLHAISPLVNASIAIFICITQMLLDQQAVANLTMTQKFQNTEKHHCLLYHQKRLAAVMSLRFPYCVRCLTDRFLAPGSSDNQLYFALAELVTSAALTPFF